MPEAAQSGSMSSPVLPEDDIRRMARARVGFRWHLASYVVVNLFLALVWFLTTGPGSYYWPVWVHMGWGIGLIFNALGAYVPQARMLAAEEQRLRRRYGREP